MSTESFPIRAESLLQHREFVRALARSLVRDEHAALDVVQETWLEALRHPPRSTAALPGWLARVVRTRAQNVARGESRRVAREQVAAREELDESEEKLREQVAMQHKVVEAVLALKEPYKTVVLLRYFEGLSPSQIAARRDVPAGSVRAQLSRAHELLRERLDADFGGSRAAWSVALVGLAKLAPRSSVPLKVALLGGALAVAAVVPVAWKVLSNPSSQRALARASTSTAIDASAAPTSVLADPSPSTGAPKDARVSIESTETPPQTSTYPVDFGALSVPDALALAKQVQTRLQARLLVPDKDVPEVRAALARHPDLALARILPYGRLEGDTDGRFLGVRGAGADYSFTWQSNDYYMHPDIHLDREFRASFDGFIFDVGEVDLGEIAVPKRNAPLEAMAYGHETWNLFWTDAHTNLREFDKSLIERANSLKLENRAPAGIGHTYLVRSILPGAFDRLGAFEVLSKDEYGYTFAWKLLYAWPLPEGAERVTDGARIDRLRGITEPPVPEWLAQLGVPELMDVSHRIRSAAEPRLFPKRPDLEQKYASILSSSDAGLARLLHRHAFDAIVDGRERGTFFSFKTRSNDYDEEEDLRFEQGQFCGRNATGIFMDLGSVGIDEVGRWGASGPSDMTEPRRKTWELLWSLRHAENLLPDQRGRALDEEGQRLVREAGLEGGVPAVQGHSYLERSIYPEKHDLLVAFQVIDTDEYGLWIVWRILRRW